MRSTKIHQRRKAIDTEKDPYLSKFMTNYVMERSTQLNATTKEAVADVIRRVFDSGADADQLNSLVLDTVREQFDGYEQWRANRIARSETAIGYNHANVLGYATAGVGEVEVEDGVDVTQVRRRVAGEGRLVGERGENDKAVTAGH